MPANRYNAWLHTRTWGDRIEQLENGIEFTSSPLSPLTEITEVLPAAPGGALAGFSLDAPAPGAADTYALDLRGWVVGAHSPVASVLVLRDGVLLRRLPVEIERPDVAAAHPGLPGAQRSGFFGTLSALSLEPRFELQIEVLLEDGTRLPLALVRGTRAPLRSSFEPQPAAARC